MQQSQSIVLLASPALQGVSTVTLCLLFPPHQLCGPPQHLTHAISKSDHSYSITASLKCLFSCYFTFIHPFGENPLFLTVIPNPLSPGESFHPLYPRWFNTDARPAITPRNYSPTEVLNPGGYTAHFRENSMLLQEITLTNP